MTPAEEMAHAIRHASEAAADGIAEVAISRLTHARNLALEEAAQRVESPGYNVAQDEQDELDAAAARIRGLKTP